jgi:hypothetical protein
MSQAMDELMSRYSDAELAIIADFLTRAAAITADQIARVRGEPNPTRTEPGSH